MVPNWRDTVWNARANISNNHRSRLHLPLRPLFQHVLSHANQFGPPEVAHIAAASNRTIFLPSVFRLELFPAPAIAAIPYIERIWIHDAPPSCVLVRTRYTDGEIVSRKKIQKIFGEKKRGVSPSALSVKRCKGRSCAQPGPGGPIWNWLVETRPRASPGAESLRSSA